MRGCKAADQHHGLRPLNHGTENSLYFISLYRTSRYRICLYRTTLYRISLYKTSRYRISLYRTIRYRNSLYRTTRYRFSLYRTTRYRNSVQDNSVQNQSVQDNSVQKQSVQDKSVQKQCQFIKQSVEARRCWTRGLGRPRTTKRARSTRHVLKGTGVSAGSCSRPPAFMHERPSCVGSIPR